MHNSQNSHLMFFCRFLLSQFSQDKITIPNFFLPCLVSIVSPRKMHLTIFLLLTQGRLFMLMISLLPRIASMEHLFIAHTLMLMLRVSTLKHLWLRKRSSQLSLQRIFPVVEKILDPASQCWEMNHFLLIQLLNLLVRILVSW